MKKIGVILLAGVLASLISSAAIASTPRIGRREALQRARIAQGRQCGDLTRREMVRLNSGQRRVHRMERRAGADGVVTRVERRQCSPDARCRLSHGDRVACFNDFDAVLL